MRKFAVVSALLAVLFWSTNALAAKFALNQISVYQLLLLQFGSASIALIAVKVFRFGGAALVQDLPSFRTLIIGCAGITCTIFLQYKAFDLGSILEVNVIAYSWPLFVAIWAALMTRNIAGYLRLVLAIIGFFGVSMIFDPNGGLDLMEVADLGSFFALASAITMAFFTIASSKVRSIESMLIPATILGTLVSLVALFVYDQPVFDYQAWLISIYIGIGPMAAGYFLWTLAMSGEGAKKLAPIAYATPLLSTVILLLAGEDYTNRTLLGISIVIVASIGVLATQNIKSDPLSKGQEVIKRKKATL